MPVLTSASAPVTESQRIMIIDALRGIAILGILLMNIPGFGLPMPVSWDPGVLNEMGTVNFIVWFLVSWIPEGTQRAIFSLLFGAGILLFTGRKAGKLEGTHLVDLFIRRQLWLMAFGLFDAYVLLWYGDILFDYGCYGLIMLAFRKLSPRALLTGAAICLFAMVARENRDLYKEKEVIFKGERVARIDTFRTRLSETQKEDLSAMKELKEKSTRQSKLEMMNRAIRKTTGSYADVYEFRTDTYLSFIVHYLYLQIWDVLLFMFLGMAFYKLGILTGQASAKWYWIMAIGGIGLGLTLSYFRLQPMIDLQFNDYEYKKHVRFDWYTISRTLRSLGFFGLIMLMFKSGWFNRFLGIFRPVGQMAFTNYLTQSVICGLFFYGIGLGMYGRLQRHEIYYVVFAVWVIQIIWSNLWLRYFYFGPMEWVWRSLTYWKRQPFRKRSISS